MTRVVVRHLLGAEFLSGASVQALQQFVPFDQRSRMTACDTNEFRD